MPINILQKIQLVENAVKTHFTGNLPTTSTGADWLLTWLPGVTVLQTNIKKKITVQN